MPHTQISLYTACFSIQFSLLIPVIHVIYMLTEPVAVMEVSFSAVHPEKSINVTWKEYEKDVYIASYTLEYCPQDPTESCDCK